MGNKLTTKEHIRMAILSFLMIIVSDFCVAMAESLNKMFLSKLSNILGYFAIAICSISIMIIIYRWIFKERQEVVYNE